MKKIFLMIGILLFFQCFAWARTIYGARLMKDNDGDGKPDKTLGVAMENKADFDAYIAKKVAEGWIVCDTWQQNIPESEDIVDGAGSIETLATGCGPIDCDPADPAKWRRVKLYVDLDGDGHASGTVTLCIGNQPPPGHSEAILPIGDCDPLDPDKWKLACVSTPVPGRPKQWTNANMCIGITLPPGTWLCSVPPPPTADLSFNVIPNPVSGRLNIIPESDWSDRFEIALTDPFARVVRFLQMPNANKGQIINLNTSDLKPGIYQLTIRRGELIESKTIAVKL